MRRLGAIFIYFSFWVVIGVITLNPIRDMLVDKCQPRWNDPSKDAAAIILWPYALFTALEAPRSC